QQLERQTDPLIEALRQPPLSPHQSPEPSGAGLEKTLLTPHPSPPASHQPFQIDGYRIVRELGRGGMGVVYEAYQHRLHRQVAIKMILTGTLAGPEDRVRFMMEGE